jgi:hypothetical protein
MPGGHKLQYFGESRVMYSPVAEATEMKGRRSRINSPAVSTKRVFLAMSVGCVGGEAIRGEGNYQF